jgi:hypothetical protein
LLRVRLNDADAISRSGLPTFKELMTDRTDRLPDGFDHDAYDELLDLGHLDPGASGKKMGGDAFGRLSAYGCAYLGEQSE